LVWIKLYSNQTIQGSCGKAIAELRVGVGWWSEVVIDENLVDVLTVFFSLVFNVVMMLVFVFRGQRRTQAEARLGPVSNLLLVPFSVL